MVNTLLLQVYSIKYPEAFKCIFTACETFQRQGWAKHFQKRKIWQSYGTMTNKVCWWYWEETDRERRRERYDKMKRIVIVFMNQADERGWTAMWIIIIWQGSLGTRASKPKYKDYFISLWWYIWHSYDKYTYNRTWNIAGYN